ncbi:cupin domain-containing protein [Azospirillum canadense]|uniref:cupin n=1 Tax=Azospirillum canadense TaxID=403962 RepID=UPI002226728E|nr:cupin [Azospirillum canadense]MCW2238650.1 mannose-6-phosphate isomerase-like protein (cupin superfamily) [Azospirillum canadense]
MKIVQSRSFRPATAWAALDIAEIDGATVRLHWTDKPYRWHVNAGDEVFAVLGGAVDMHFRIDGREEVARLGPGDLFHAGAGDEHVAHPVGEARILVIERKGSV